MSVHSKGVTDSAYDWSYDSLDEQTKDCIEDQRVATEKLLAQISPRDWSQAVAEEIAQIATTEGVNFSHESSQMQEIYRYGDRKVVLTKHLVGGTGGDDDGTIAVFIKRDDFESCAWLRQALDRHPMPFVVED
jgi:hypothetical protein